MDATHLREAALREISKIEWIPGWSINRLSSMVAE
jgi:isoleucyl-tRNA synthetase